jgi:hypothetical protein
MYDDLIKRLNVFRLKEDEYQIIPVYVSEIIGQAADAIEELRRSEAVALENCADEHNKRLNLEQRMRWIPVTERLPEYNEQVLVYAGFFQSYTEVAYYCGEWRFAYDDTEVAVVYYWMPLPEPPDEDDTPICTKASLASRGIYKKAEEK